MRAAVVGIAVFGLTFGWTAAPGWAQKPQVAPSTSQASRFGRSLSVLRLPVAAQNRLKLTDEQKTRIEAINTRYRPEIQAAVQAVQKSSDRQASMKKVTELARKADTEGMEVLTPDQKKQLDLLQTEAINYNSLGRAGNALLAVTNLTEDQKNKLKGLGTETQAKRQELIRSLSQAPADQRRASFEKIRALEKESTGKIRAVLTPDQLKYFDFALNARPTRPARPVEPAPKN